MTKDSFYFQHDYNARNDEKVIKLLQLKGSAGYGNYWMIIEMLYEAGGIMRLDYDCIAFALRTQCDEVKALINDFGLFEVNDSHFTSKRVQDNLAKRDEKSESGRKSALKRWVGNANAMPTQSEPNAIKEMKGNEIIGNKKKLKITPSASLKKVHKNETVFPKDLDYLKGQPYQGGPPKDWKEAQNG